MSKIFFRVSLILLRKFDCKLRRKDCFKLRTVRKLLQASFSPPPKFDRRFEMAKLELIESEAKPILEINAVGESEFWESRRVTMPAPSAFPASPCLSYGFLRCRSLDTLDD